MTMKKPIFDVLLVPKEWRTLEALNHVGKRAVSRTVYERMEAGALALQQCHQILGRLAQCGLVIRHQGFTGGPFGAEPQVLWEVSPEAKRLFFS